MKSFSTRILNYIFKLPIRGSVAQRYIAALYVLVQKGKALACLDTDAKARLLGDYFLSPA